MAGRSSKGGERLLNLRGNVWWFRQQVPEACRKVLGAGPRFLLVNLGTSDVVEAKKRRNELEALTRLQFGQIKEGRRTALQLPDWAAQSVQGGIASPAARGALARASIEAARDMQEPLADEEDDWGRDTPLDLALFSAEEEARRLRPADRRAFEDALIGRVDIDYHLGAYLSKADLAPKTLNERRGLIGRFASWCRAKDVKLDRVDRRTAGRYVSEVIDPMHAATQTKHLTALRSYWKFLAQRGLINLPPAESVRSGWPWNEQQLDKGGKRIERGAKVGAERPFTDEEVRKLLYSPFPLRPDWEALMRDVLRVSLLSGMRLAEVLTLWVEEVHDGVFDIQHGKTSAAARKVPIHPDLREIIERRTKGKAGKDWLFHEMQNERDPGDTFGKRFNRFREAVGVDDRRPGIRRSLVNFHSARRWFTTKARHAGHPKETIAEIVGHAPDKKDVTFGVYARGASEEQRRTCVAAVRLPENTFK